MTDVQREKIVRIAGDHGVGHDDFGIGEWTHPKESEFEAIVVPQAGEVEQFATPDYQWVAHGIGLLESGEWFVKSGTYQSKAQYVLTEDTKFYLEFEEALEEWKERLKTEE